MSNRLDYRDISKSLSKDYASRAFLLDNAKIERVTTVRTPGGGTKQQRTLLPTVYPCRVSGGERTESNEGGRDIASVAVTILLPPGTNVQPEDAIQVTNSDTKEVRKYEVRGIKMATFEVLRKVQAVEIT